MKESIQSSPLPNIKNRLLPQPPYETFKRRLDHTTKGNLHQRSNERRDNNQKDDYQFSPSITTKQASIFHFHFHFLHINSHNYHVPVHIPFLIIDVPLNQNDNKLRELKSKDLMDSNYGKRSIDNICH